MGSLNKVQEQDQQMAKLNELKIQHLKKELEQRGLLTTGNDGELHTSTAMEAEVIDADEYVFQLEVEKLSTKVEKKAEPPSPSQGIEMMNAILELPSQLSSEISQMCSRIASEMSSLLSLQLAQISAQMSRIPTKLSSKIDAQLERNHLEHGKGETDGNEVHQTDEKETTDIAEDQSDVIKEMFNEPDQCVIIGNSDEEYIVESEEIIEEVPQADECVVHEKQLAT